MFILTYVILLFGLSVFFYVLSKFFTKKKIPKGLKALPGLVGWPLVGNLLCIHEPLCKFLLRASKKYGPIFTFTLGLREIVVLSSSKILNTTLKEMGVNFSGRWQNIMVKIIVHDSGIVFKDQEWWAVQRSFTLKALKDFGLGKQRSNEIVSQECLILLKEIEESCGKVISTRGFFPKFTVNVISKLVMNMRFEREQKDFQSLTRVIEQTAQNDNFLVTFILMYPVIENFPKFTQFLLRCIGLDQEIESLHNFIKFIIDEHKSRFNIENEGEDLIDIFLKEQYQLEQDRVKNHTFTDWQLIRVVFELFAAGYETTSTTLTWSMLLMAYNQDVQEKVHQEIINVIGSNRIPNLSDKRSLPYTQAVMNEIFRLSSVVPLSIPHRVLESTDVDGFFIPKNSIVFPNIYACHCDEEVWEKPFDFYPEHFLTKLDNGEIVYTPRDELVPFGLGKRQCLGEALARMEFFIFLTSILQRFRVQFKRKLNKKEFSKLIQGTDGIIRAPNGSDVIFESRIL